MVFYGVIWAGFLSNQHFATRTERVKELARFAELRFLDRFDVLVPLVFATSIYLFGSG